MRTVRDVRIPRPMHLVQGRAALVAAQLLPSLCAGTADEVVSAGVPAAFAQVRAVGSLGVASMNEPIEIELPYTRPPLTLNQGMHWQVKRKVIAQIRSHVAWAAHADVLPAMPAGCDHVTVQLHYTPKDKRRRDDNNLVATLKPCKDGIVDAGIVPDDTPNWMTAPMPIINAPDRDHPRLYLVITFGGN